MKLPWVSRSEYDLAIVQLNAARTAGEQYAAWWAGVAARYDDLLAKYHMLKLQGATAPEPQRAVESAPRDPVMEAVNVACAGKDAKVRAAMLTQVKRDRTAKMPDAEIILRIQRGSRPAAADAPDAE